MVFTYIWVVDGVNVGKYTIPLVFQIPPELCCFGYMFLGSSHTSNPQVFGSLGIYPLSISDIEDGYYLPVISEVTRVSMVLI